MRVFRIFTKCRKYICEHLLKMRSWKKTTATLSQKTLWRKRLTRVFSEKRRRAKDSCESFSKIDFSKKTPSMLFQKSTLPKRLPRCFSVNTIIQKGFKNTINNYKNAIKKTRVSSGKRLFQKDSRESFCAKPIFCKPSFGNRLF